MNKTLPISDVVVKLYVQHCKQPAAELGLIPSCKVLIKMII